MASLLLMLIQWLNGNCSCCLFKMVIHLQFIGFMSILSCFYLSPLFFQVAVESSLAPPNQVLATGTCILVEGILRQPLTQGKHALELRADKVIHVGTVDSSSYMLTKKRLPLDILRSCLHFRPRTTTVIFHRISD